MTRKEALAELIAKVEAGDIAKAPFWKVWVPEGQDGNLAYTAKQAASGSLDAAKALQEAVLPGWWVQYLGQNLAGWGVRLESKSGLSIPSEGFPSRHACPARAWLLAILRALHGWEPDA